MDNCYICGGRATETHHVFAGRGRRQLSDRYGLVVRLCRDCHDDVHRHPARYEWLHEDFQRKAMQEQGWTIQEFIDRFGKNYI